MTRVGGDSHQTIGDAFLVEVWEYVAGRDEYYLHLFCPEQPGLNWGIPSSAKRSMTLP